MRNLIEMVARASGKTVEEFEQEVETLRGQSPLRTLQVRSEFNGKQLVQERLARLKAEMGQDSLGKEIVGIKLKLMKAGIR